MAVSAPLDPRIRALGELARAMKQDPPSVQKKVYLHVRQREVEEETRTAAREKSWADEDKQIEEIIQRWEASIAATRASRRRSLKPSAEMPRKTYWQRVKAFFADYMTNTYWY